MHVPDGAGGEGNQQDGTGLAGLEVQEDVASLLGRNASVYSKILYAGSLQRAAHNVQ